MADVVFRLAAQIPGVREEPTTLLGFEGVTLLRNAAYGTVEMVRESLCGEHVLRITVTGLDCQPSTVIVAASDVLSALAEFRLIDDSSD